MDLLPGRQDCETTAYGTLAGFGKGDEESPLRKMKFQLACPALSVQENCLWYDRIRRRDRNSYPRFRVLYRTKCLDDFDSYYFRLSFWLRKC